MITILNINLIAGRTGAAKLCKTISEWLPYTDFSYHTLVGYNFWNNNNTTSVYTTSKGRRYTIFRYKLSVWLNFLFDRLTPWHIDMKFLQEYTPYQQADIVHIHSIQWWYIDWTILLQISKEKKIIMTVHDDRLVSWNDDDKNLFSYKTSFSYQKRKEIFANLSIIYVGVSHWMSNKIRSDTIVWDNKIRTIYNGINTSIFQYFNKIEARKTLWLPLNKKIIISIAWSGSKSNLKWLQYIKRIMTYYKNNKNYLFITIWNSVTKVISDSYHEIGLIDSEEIAKYYNSADCFLYPTLADSFGLVVAESIACWCPVVTFDVWWVPEIVEHKKSWYIATYKDLNDLVRWFEWVMANKDTMNMTLDKKFHQETMIQQYANLYKSLMRSS